VPLRELALAAMQDRTLDGAVALTFDDGYRDNLEVAVPILAEFEAPATFFLTSEQLDRPRRFWWDVLEASVLQASADELVLRIGGEDWARPLGAARSATHDELYDLLKRSGPAVRDDLVRQLTSSVDVPETDPGRPLLSAEMRRLASLPGVEIGAHSVHHLDLAAAGPTELFQEIFECRTSLERVVGRPVDLFAYPYGSVSPGALEMAAAAGYLCAVTSESRPLRPYERAHRLPRRQVPSVGGDAFTAWLMSCEQTAS
jgi:peptidoglycan/xylan/chitin deacetylase (PgdA/CDA1 family)